MKLPEPHGKADAWERYALGLLEPDGFAATYFRAVEEAEDKADMGYSYKHSFKEGDEASNQERQIEAACKTINDRFLEMRWAVDSVMQRYLLEHDGRVDMWPEPRGRHVFSVEYLSFQFHLFGNDFESNAGLSVRRKKPAYSCEPLETDMEKHWIGKAEIQKRKLEDREYSLKKKAAKERKNCRIWLIVGGLLAAAALLIAANMAFDIKEPLTVLLSVISRVCSEQGLGVELFPILRIVCLILCALGVIQSAGACAEYRKALKKAREAERERRDYVGGQYVLDAEEDERRKPAVLLEQRQEREFYNQWRSAWFEWAVRVGDIPKDAL